MMKTSLRLLVASGTAATLFTATPVAYSQMYRWVDDRGSVTYSDELPADRTGIRQLTMIDDGSRKTTRSERRTREILEAEGLLAPETQPNGGSTSAPEAANAQDALAAPPAMNIPRNVGSGRAEAVRDPCLLSSDPKCIERNRSAYIPGRGYAPGAAREAETWGSGATGGSAGATLAGGAPPRAKLEAPRASRYALPPGHTLPIIPTKR